MGKYFNDCTNPGELDARYQQICQVFNINEMSTDNLFKVEVEEEYKAKMESFSKESQKSDDGAEKYTLKQIEEWVEVNHLDGERIGRWIWVSSKRVNGHKADLKRLGFRFSKSKNCYYWRAAGDKSMNENPIPLSAIREKYGSQDIGLSH